MANPRDSMWTLSGLTVRELLRRTIVESWRDEVFGQAGRMAFYHFLALFPAILLFLIATSRIPHLGLSAKDMLEDLSGQVLPRPVAQLFQQMVEELNQHARSTVGLFAVIVGALWASLNSTWAMVYGLNSAYEVEERRSWRSLGTTVVGLTFSLGLTICIVLSLMLCGKLLQPHLTGSILFLRCVEWGTLVVCLSIWFSILYRFAPHLRDPKWQWSTPGALCALLLWIVATIGIRIYFGHFNNYARSYGHLNTVVMLLLWLYVTNAAILIGGEMNSEIEKAAASRRHDPADSLRSPS